MQVFFSKDDVGFTLNLDLMAIFWGEKNLIVHLDVTDLGSCAKNLGPREPGCNFGGCWDDDASTAVPFTLGIWAHKHAAVERHAWLLTGSRFCHDMYDCLVLST